MADHSSTVWMVHRQTGMDGVKGTLVLEGSALVFRPESGGATDSIFRLSGISRIRRIRGSPILEVHVQDPGGPPVVGFYFTKPPSLEVARDSGHLFKRRAVRRSAVSRLRQWNAVKRGEVSGWVRTLKEAGRNGADEPEGRD
jgi:hypothetical protein